MQDSYSNASQQGNHEIWNYNVNMWYTDENKHDLHYQTEVNAYFYFLGKIGFLPYL